MRVILRVVSGPDEGKCIWLREEQVLRFGRATHADHAFPSDSQMSGLHCGVECQGKLCRVRDLGSTNGTYVNGERVGERELNHGDEILAGRTRIRVEIDERPRTEIRVPSAVLRRVAAAKGNSPPVLVPVSPGNDEASSLPAAPPVRPLLRWLASRLPPAAGEYLRGLTDAVPAVRREAAIAAVWTRQSWFLDACRAAAEEASAEDDVLHYFLAVLGKPVDLARIQRLAQCEQLGPRRFDWLGTFGHPAVVEHLIAAMSSREPRCAVAAGRAFTKITGVVVASDQMVPAPDPVGAPDGSAGEPDDLTLPDPRLARGQWQAIQARFHGGATRWCSGLPMDQRLEPSAWAQLSLVSRHEVCWREHYEGRWRWAPDRIARFPIVRASAAR
ncbi:MAG: FHA domain-containing protein [Pirellulaceae bacterium]